MTSQPDSDSNITKELKEFRQIIEDMEAKLDTIPPRLHTTRTLTTYETDLQKVLVGLRNASTSKMPKVAVLNYIRYARDELTLAIQEFSDNGINKDFIFYIRQCRDNLENALKLWS